MSEHKQLEHYITVVQRAVTNARDEKTRLLRLFVLALAQGELEGGRMKDEGGRMKAKGSSQVSIVPMISQ